MHVSINGLLLRAAERVERTRDAKYLGWGLRELLDHIRELRKDPVGAENDACLFEASTLFAQVVACWGADGVWLGRQDHVAELLKGRHLFHLGLTKGGSPRHPLYLPKSVEPVLWKGGE